MKKLAFLLVVMLPSVFFGCRNMTNNRTLQAGTWRGVLHRSDGIGIPFNFEVQDSGKVLYIKNGEGRLKVDSIRYVGDSVFIHMPFFNSDFLTYFQNDGALKGQWVKHYPDTNRTLGFTAEPNTAYRITPAPRSAKFNVTGRWRTNFFTPGTGDSSIAIGEFKQQGNRLTGTFLTKYGDYRYLQGVVSGDSLFLSTFDGSHIYLFEAAIENDSTITDGVYYAGFQGKESWTAVKDSTASLPDAFSITTYKPGMDQLDFTFPDLEGNPVSISDEQFKNKVVIVQILGSWCPNCMDETQFLSNWYQQNKSKDIAVVGLCYERSSVFQEAVNSVMTFKKRFGVSYPLLITGVALNDPHLMEKTLPQLEHFISFPTTIFLNKKGRIAKIHAGFAGPGTGSHFQAYKKEFNHIVDSLLSLPR